MMKTSEFIRNAVDKYLTDTPYRSQLADTSKQKIGLCGTFVEYRRDDKTSWPQLSNASRLLNQIMHDARTGLWLFPISYSCDPSTREFSQTTRFMLAEFMALYFEDQGD